MIPEDDYLEMTQEMFPDTMVEMIVTLSEGDTEQIYVSMAERNEILQKGQAFVYDDDGVQWDLKWSEEDGYTGIIVHP